MDKEFQSFSLVVMSGNIEHENIFDKAFKYMDWQRVLIVSEQEFQSGKLFAISVLYIAVLITSSVKKQIFY